MYGRRLPSDLSGSRRLQIGQRATVLEKRDSAVMSRNGASKTAPGSAGTLQDEASSLAAGKLRECQVPGCRVSRLETLKRSIRICDEHKRALVLEMDGFKGRFCQQCSRVHDLSRFDGDKRGCRQRLKMRHIARLRASRAAPSAATLAVGDDDNSSNNKLVVTANINSSSRDSDVGSGLSSSPPPRIRTITHPPPAPILAAGGVYQGVGWWETDVEVFVADKKHLMRHSRLLGLPYSSRRTTAAEDSLSKSLAWTLSVPSSAGSSSGSSQRVPHAPARPTSNHDYPSFELMNYLDSSAAGILNTVASDDDGIRRRLYWTQQFGTTEGKSVSAPLPQQSSCDPIDQQSLTTYSALLATCGSAYNGRFMMADANLSGMAESSAGAYQPADWFGDEGDDTATNNMNNPDQSLLSSQDYYDGRPESWPSGYSSMQHGHHQPAVSACYPDCSEMISHNTATNIKFSRTWYEQHHDNLSS